MNKRLKLLYSPDGDGGAGAGGAGAGGEGGGAGAGGAGAGGEGGGAGAGAGGAGAGSGQQQQSTQSYFDAVTDPEIRDAAKKMFPDHKDLNSVVKTAVHQQRLLGQPKVTLPGKDAKPEEVKAFYVKNFGVPEKPEGYTFGKVVMPEGFDISKNGVKDFKEVLKPFAPVFHAANLNEEQATSVVNAFFEHSKGQIEAAKTAQDTMAADTRTALQKEWKGDFDAKMNKAELALHTLGDDAFVEQVKAAGLHNNLAFVKFLSNVSELMSEDRASSGMSPGGFASGPNQAQTEIDTLKADEKFMKDYNNVNSPNFQASRERMRRLYEVRAGERGRKTL